MSEGELPILSIFTIYKSPSDFPGLFVVRCWSIGPTPDVDNELIGTRSDLEEARDLVRLQGPRHCLGREVDDDPVIVESWVF